MHELGLARAIAATTSGTWESHDRSDYQAVMEGYISVTPLHPDMTAHSVLPAVEELSLEMLTEVQ